jgi:uncharacterized metal-binding protein YceD (DUF177 family)
MTAELAWDEAVRDVPRSGLERKRDATPEERERIARALDLQGCARLSAAYTVKPLDLGRYVLRGKLSALVEQTCVVSLEPITTSIEETFESTFLPPHEIPEPPGGAVDIDDDMDPEPIVEGRIEVGRVVFECLAEAIDPFPRKAGATLEWQPDTAATDRPETANNPFSVLAKIKR